MKLTMKFKGRMGGSLSSHSCYDSTVLAQNRFIYPYANLDLLLELIELID